jgi:D-inositol-3-phosphate glycosyltransferase
LITDHGEEQWADAFTKLLEDPAERMRMGANAAGHAARFSWDNTAEATLRSYVLALNPHTTLREPAISSPSGG